MSTPIKLNVHFSKGSHNHRVIRKGKQPGHSKSIRLPRVTRLMALAVKYEHLLSDGLVESHRELADLAGVERSHLSTILRFRLLAPQIQEWLLCLPESEQAKDPVGLIELRHLASINSWEKQCKELEQILIKKQSGFSFPA